MRLFVALILLIIPLSAEAKRVALVIGNSNYESEATLRNAGNDAKGIAKTLESLNFDVIYGSDLDHRTFADVLRIFEHKLEGAEVAAFYYAGHGIQFEGKNYLLPVSAELSNHFLFSAETIALDAVVGAMTRQSKTSLILVDACRDNPFVDRLQQSLPATRSAATSRGLARLASRPKDAIVVYATQSDAVALDGDGDHSPFANALMRHLTAPETEIGLAMRRVIGEVRKVTNGAQSPEISISLSGELYLNMDVSIGIDAAPRSAPRVATPESPPSPQLNEELETMWREGLALSANGQIDRYYDIMQQAYDIALSAYGANSHQYAQANNHMSGPLSSLGRHEEAADASREAIRVFETLYGPDSTRVANDKANLAGRLRTLGQIDEAEKNFQEAIAIYERARRVGWDHTGYAIALGSYGRLVADLGDPETGLALAYKAIQVLETSRRTKDRHYGQTIMAAADLEHGYGDCETARALFKKALPALHYAGLGSSHWDVKRSKQMGDRPC